MRPEVTQQKKKELNCTSSNLKILYFKRYHQESKKKKEWNKIFSKHIFDNKLASEICKDHLELNNKNTIQLKNGHRILTDISPKKIDHWPIALEKILNTINHQGIASQNHNDIPLHNH